MRTLLLTVAYDGTDYAGFQIQLNGNTIQAEIEKALFRLTGSEIRITGSGRTDAGVHAAGQAISFDTDSRHQPATFVKALNAMLPRDIVVLNAEEAPRDSMRGFARLEKPMFIGSGLIRSDPSLSGDMLPIWGRLWI